MPLANFPKTFGLNEMKKGFFPHKFNTPENQSYIGPFPAASFYQSEFFSVKKKQEFDQWYEKNKENEFNFRKEFEEYCCSDVCLLTEGCLAFRKINMEQSQTKEKPLGVDPFQVAFTLASLCNYLFRSFHMESETIGIIPENGYNPQQKTSMKCQLWLKYESEKSGISIQHAKDENGEKKCDRYLLDGFSEEHKRIYEFQGCFFHGCLNCYPESMFNPVKQMHQKSIHMQHVDRMNKIKSIMPNYQIIEMWEHTWDKMSKTDPNLIEFLKNNEMRDPLKPRDALYGGRTEAFNLYYKCKNGEKINYFDYTSLYPWAQKYGIFPVGHGRIITSNFDYTKKYFGLMSCRIIPPRNLRMPVLPARINKKLMFTCCYKCTTLLQNQKC